MMQSTSPRLVLLTNPRTANETTTEPVEAKPVEDDYVPIKKMPRREGPSIDYLIEHYQRSNGIVFDLDLYG